MCETEDVKNQCDLAVSHDGRAGIRSDPFELLAERFDHDLLGVGNVVDDEAELPAVGLQHDDAVAGLLLRAIRSIQFQFTIQIHQGKQVAAQTINRNSADQFNLLGFAIVESHQFKHADLRNGETFPAATHKQCRNDGERKRDSHADGCAFSGRRLEVDGPADLFDVGPHNIHADPAAGYIGDFFRGGKSGEEDKVKSLALGQLLRPVAASSCRLDRLVADAVDVRCPRHRR